jgi:hypothetical protein
MKNLMRILLICLLITPALAQAQQQEEAPEKKGFDKDRIFFGGNVGMRLNEAFYLDLSPLAGYQLTPKFSSGLGITYRYFKAPEQAGFSIYGARVFSRYDIHKPFFIYTEYENLNIATEYVVNEGKFTSRKWIPSLFAGGGILQPLGKGIGLSISIMYNFMFDSSDGLYARPYVVRAGFVFLPRI